MRVRICFQVPEIKRISLTIMFRVFFNLVRWNHGSSLKNSQFKELLKFLQFVPLFDLAGLLMWNNNTIFNASQIPEYPAVRDEDELLLVVKDQR